MIDLHYFYSSYVIPFLWHFIVYLHFLLLIMREQHCIERVQQQDNNVPIRVPRNDLYWKHWMIHNMEKV